MIACDDDYKDSDKTRCALVFVYDMLDYIQNSEGDFLHAGVNAPDNSISFNFLTPNQISDGPKVFKLGSTDSADSQKYLTGWVISYV